MEGEESSEEEDEIRHHLNTMLKAMQQIDKANEERNAKFDSLMEISLTQQQTNLQQPKYIDDILMREGLKRRAFSRPNKSEARSSTRD